MLNKPPAPGAHIESLVGDAEGERLRHIAIRRAKPRIAGHALRTSCSYLPALILICSLCSDTVEARADRIPFTKVVKASLVFRDESKPADHYPHRLQVFLRLQNVHDGEVHWVSDVVSGIHAELLDGQGKPVTHPPSAASIQSNLRPMSLPYGSLIDWLITHGGVSMAGDASDKYALVIGGKGWLIPIESASSYSLRIRLYGHPWTSDALRQRLGEPELLLDLPPAKLEIAK